MAKLCAKGKAAAKRKFKVYPSAYANMYASGVCSGKIKPGGRKKAANGGYMGSHIKLTVDGTTVGNPSYKKYYKGMI